MNKRARQLAKPNLEKEWYSKYGESVQEDHYFFTPEDLDEFALLIIQECIVDFYRRHLDLNSNEDIAVQVDRYVREHFGVES